MTVFGTDILTYVNNLNINIGYIFLKTTWVKILFMCEWISSLCIVLYSIIVLFLLTTSSNFCRLHEKPIKINVNVCVDVCVPVRTGSSVCSWCLSAVSEPWNPLHRQTSHNKSDHMCVFDLLLPNAVSQHSGQRDHLDHLHVKAQSSRAEWRQEKKSKHSKQYKNNIKSKSYFILNKASRVFFF